MKLINDDPLNVCNNVYSLCCTSLTRLEHSINRMWNQASNAVIALGENHLKFIRLIGTPNSLACKRYEVPVPVAGERRRETGEEALRIRLSTYRNKFYAPFVAIDRRRWLTFEWVGRRCMGWRHYLRFNFYWNTQRTNQTTVWDDTKSKREWGGLSLKQSMTEWNRLWKHGA